MFVFDGVSYTYRGEKVPALSSFSMRAERGKVCALLGPNGAGKSTALAIAAGWLKPDRGRFLAEGSVAFLPQMERLAFSFSCLEYVTFGRAPHLPYLAVPGGKDRELAMRALERVGMADKRDKRITAISGGELQLVRLARALAQEAAWAVLDEPTDKLDPSHSLAVGGVVREIAARGGGVVFSTHDLSFALDVADTTVLVRAGAVSREGPTADVVSPDELGLLYGTGFCLKTLPVPGSLACMNDKA